MTAVVELVALIVVWVVGGVGWPIVWVGLLQWCVVRVGGVAGAGCPCRV